MSLRGADYLRVGEVAKLTGLGRETVRRRLNKGEFGDFLFDETVGYLISRAGVDEWIRARRIRVAPGGLRAVS